MSMVR